MKGFWGILPEFQFLLIEKEPVGLEWAQPDSKPRCWLKSNLQSGVFERGRSKPFSSFSMAFLTIGPVG
jgi:hypothetical protein